VGDGGTGTFTQVAGTVVLDNSAFQIGANGGTGEYNLNGGTVDLINQSTIYLGRSGGEGTLHVTGDAKFTFNGQAFIGYEAGGGTGKIIQDGAGSVVSIDTSPEHAFYFGESAGAHGIYELHAGTFTISGNISGAN